MCDCCLDHPPTFYECRTLKGRKDHKCCECLRIIPKGELHEYAKGLWDGDFSDYRTCRTCCDMREEINLTCYFHSEMMNDLDERDYTGVQSVVDFHRRRRANWDRLYGKARQLVDA